MHKSKINPSEKYFRDESNLKADPRGCRVYSPLTSAEAADIIIGSESVTFVGGATGITGASVAVSGGDILSTEKFNSLVIDPNGMSADTGAGVTLKQLHEGASLHLLWYPADSTEQTATIGGNIATNAWGTRSYKYGSVREFVKRIKVVLAEGEILDINRGDYTAKAGYINLDTGKRVIKALVPPKTALQGIKSSAGYYMKKGADLIDIFCGSEGTLGLVTQAEIKLIKKPLSVTAFMVNSEDRQKILAFIENIKDLPAFTKADSIEYMDANSAEILSKRFGTIKGGNYYAFCEFSSYSKEEEETALEIARDAALDAGIEERNAVVSDTTGKEGVIYAVREALPDAINTIMRQNGMRKKGTDFAVPRAMTSRMFELYDAVLNTCGIKYAVFGHAGDNNLHINFMPENEPQALTADECCAALAEGIVKMGGTLSAAHGIGKIKKNYMKLMYSESALKEMAALKHAFDPKYKLCPGNILP